MADDTSKTSTSMGAKRKTTVKLGDLLGALPPLENASNSKLEDLPQGLLPLEPLQLEEESPALPPVLLQVRSNMARFQNCVLLTRVGGFYELYFENATEFGPLLNLKVAQRKTGPKTNPVYVPMSGFPFFQLDRYLKILVQDLNRYVAIAEEFRNDAEARSKAGGLMNDRKVSRIITPGTLIDENFMDPFTNNYVLALHAQKPAKDEMENSEVKSDHPVPLNLAEMPIGLAWLDLSTGHFFTQSTTFGNLPSFLARIGPREIVLDEDIEKSKDHGILSVLAEERHLITYITPSAVKPIKDWAPMLESPVPPRTVNDFAPEEVAAGSTLLQYVEERLQGSNMKLQPPMRQLDTMGIDKNTMRALEIKKTMRDDLDTGSLLNTVRRTVTKGGARLLDNWLSSPSTSIGVINSRLDLVTYMLENETFRERIAVLLRRSHDSHRLLQKFAFGRGDPDDLLGLASTIRATQELKVTLTQNTAEDECMREMISRINLDGPSALADRVEEAIDEEGVVQQQIMEDGEVGEMQALAEAVVISEGSREDANILPKKKKKPTSIKEYYSDDNETWIMKPAASPTLQRLHQDLVELAAKKQALAEDLSNRLGASSLTLRSTPGLGHICHIKGKDIKRELVEGKRVSSSRTTSSFHHPEWTSLGGRIDRCRDHIRAEEQRVFRQLREQVIYNIVKLRRNAIVLDELDVASSFALLAAEKNWTRPILNRTSTHKIVGGRHPTVEGGLEREGRGFTTNDCFVGDVERTWLITGPNMAGKSTFLRQNALITILAQVGSYVPAEYAEIGIVDQIFSRVGSADDLYRDQSTFMVEMLETAAILRHATSCSFVIMDEIGRGTTPTDGTAVAFACLHHLYHLNKCRTLFATHFHDLADMAIKGDMKGVGFYCTDVEEDEGGGEGFRYVHRLRQGVNRRSHALKVARLAGLPEEAINVAKAVLERQGGSV
ncbi:DNA repair protein MutS, III [Venustampulla echinocandica]|uniref:DNA repair protein MutS, III n=1 Tax=Venustampulla echinocandica TaxID=2656787 RepID=A0A370THG9_9HELO|nr:DNA repair protein MutS, III [Venustampulla echinocandica]RDL34643.1 DNA repair protein MutS, III [Venustampulla echinocandica]